VGNGPELIREGGDSYFDRLFSYRFLKFEISSMTAFYMSGLECRFDPLNSRKAQMAFWTPLPFFGLKWKPLLRRHKMISVKTFSSEIKTISSSFIKSIYIFDIFYHVKAKYENEFSTVAKSHFDRKAFETGSKSFDWI